MAIDNPFPSSSFGDIGRTVFARCEPFAHRSGALLEVEYADDDLGWVDPTTLRLFRVDEETGDYTLLQSSWVDVDQRVVRALIDQSGVYSAIGLPGDPDILRAVEELRAFPDPWSDDAWRPRICERILCANPYEGAISGRTGRDPCDLCVGLRIPFGGLPEWELFQPTVDRNRIPEEPGHTFLEVLFETGSGFLVGSPTGSDNRLVILDLDTMTLNTSVPIGAGYYGDLATAAGVVAVTHTNTNELRLLWPSNTKVAVGPSPSAVELTKDGKTAYVATAAGIDVVDTGSAAVTKQWSLPLRPSVMSLTPDGRHLAVIGDPPSPAGSGWTLAQPDVYVFDVATGIATVVTVVDSQSTWPNHNPNLRSVLAANDRVYVWGAFVSTPSNLASSLYSIDIAAGAQSGCTIIDVADPADFGVAYAALLPNHRLGLTRASSSGSDVVIADTNGCTKSVTGGFSGQPVSCVAHPKHPDVLFVLTHDSAIDGSYCLDRFDTSTGVVTKKVYDFPQVNGQPKDPTTGKTVWGGIWWTVRMRTV